MKKFDFKEMLDVNASRKTFEEQIKNEFPAQSDAECASKLKESLLKETPLRCYDIGIIDGSIIRARLIRSWFT